MSGHAVHDAPPTNFWWNSWPVPKSGLLQEVSSEQEMHFKDSQDIYSQIAHKYMYTFTFSQKDQE